MDPILELEPTRLSIAPGGGGSVKVRIQNLGERVATYAIEVKGDAQAWAEVHPSEVEIYPDQWQEAVVVFNPSDADARAGSIPFAIKATSKLKGDPSSAAAEGDIDIAAVSSVAPRITPETSSGRWRGRHQIDVTNWGNSDLRLGLTATDPNQALGFLLRPDVLDIPVGASASARLKVRARDPFMRGDAKRRDFKVQTRSLGADGTASSQPPPGFDPSQPAIAAAFMQKPVLPLGALAAIAALAIGGVVAWLLFRPDPEPEAAAPPEQPQDFQVAENPDDPQTSLLLRWQEVRNVDGYEIRPVNCETGDAAEPIPVEAPANSYPVPDLAPGTRHCYRLAALLGDSSSTPTDVQEATTRGPNPPASPTDVAVDPPQEGKATVTWTDTQNEGAEYFVLVIRNGVPKKVQKTEMMHEETLQDGETCFQVTTFVQGAGESAPAPTEPACVEYEATTTAPTTDPQEQELVRGETGWIGEVNFELTTLKAAVDRRNLLRTSNAPILAAENKNVQVLRTSDYPSAGFAQSGYSISVPGFSSSDEVSAFCAQFTPNCTPRELGSASATPTT